MNEQAKHTPGPWTYQWLGNEHHAVSCDIRLMTEQRKTDVVCEIRDSCGLIVRSERSANARLIAAAPDLLEACKAALEVLGDEKCWYDHHGLCQAHHLRTNDNGEPECEVKLLKEAITKAEGA